MSRELYERVEPQPKWADAVNGGLFNCADAGGWLRQVAAGALLIEDREQAIERMARFWREDRGECKDDHTFFSGLLAAAEGRET